MTNFIFKSQRDLQKISQQLKTILDNQRYLRMDISSCNLQLTKIYNALALERQVNDHYERQDQRPQTEDLD